MNPTEEEFHDDIWRMSKYYTKSEIIHQYAELGIYITNSQYDKYKYKLK